ncbi:MAG: Rieske 2Fe-2S domain-containing protein [Alphaproteobacteria bacterium]|nr:Rieske 2Fe-2S domain-containing protein [Alphaproteobacteria bacterium]
MGHVYKNVQWTPFKKAYDLGFAAGVVAFIAVFVAASLVSWPAAQTISIPQILIRAFGACAFGLLHVILLIGPLARLAPQAFLPLLYNRRHLGVACFVVALAHAALATMWYHGFSDLNPLVSLLASNPRYAAINGFPFEALGVAALLILFVMAATSHDFWNANLGPGVWKALHMAVHPAYALLAGHVLLGALQTEQAPLYAGLTGAGAALVVAAHLAAGLRQMRKDRVQEPLSDAWIRVGALADIEDKRAVIVTPPSGAQIAVFRDGETVHAISNYCRHQGGPLGEGRIIDGCVTCPWHGFQYRPEDGRSPPPYAEQVPIFRTRLEQGIVFVHPDPEFADARA